MGKDWRLRLEESELSPGLFLLLLAWTQSIQTDEAEVAISPPPSFLLSSDTQRRRKLNGPSQALGKQVLNKPLLKEVVINLISCINAYCHLVYSSSNNHIIIFYNFCVLSKTVNASNKKRSWLARDTKQRKEKWNEKLSAASASLFFLSPFPCSTIPSLFFFVRIIWLFCCKKKKQKMRKRQISHEFSSFSFVRSVMKPNCRAKETRRRRNFAKSFARSKNMGGKGVVVSTGVFFSPGGKRE